MTIQPGPSLCRRLPLIASVISMLLIAATMRAAVTSDVLPHTKTELPASLDDALKLLHTALNDNKKAIPALMDSIQRLKTHAETRPPLAKALVYDTIATLYESINMDSCIIYYGKGVASARLGGDEVLAQRMRLQMLAHMPVTGVVLEG